jgi:FkbM family methyltransferase
MLKKYIKRLLAIHRRNKLADAINRMALSLHKGFENLDYDYEKNGEFDVLRKISNTLVVETIFDVGANIGNWTINAAKIFPNARIYSFEIVESTYKSLKNNCIDYHNVNVFNFGLSHKKDKIDVYYSPDDSGAATGIKDFSHKFHGRKVQIVSGVTISGQDFCENNDIDHIDFLKIDVEGFEPNVLRGFSNMLERGAIQIIQFEYGYINIKTNFLLRDFYELLKKYNMQIGKIYPNYVEFKAYDYKDENFMGPNYLAVHNDLHDLIETLSD